MESQKGCRAAAGCGLDWSESRALEATVAHAVQGDGKFAVEDAPVGSARA